jgi:hypothetical protein
MFQIISRDKKSKKKFLTVETTCCKMLWKVRDGLQVSHSHRQKRKFKKVLYTDRDKCYDAPVRFGWYLRVERETDELSFHTPKKVLES